MIGCATVVLSCLAMLPLMVSCTIDDGVPARENKDPKPSVESQRYNQNEIWKAARKEADLKGAMGMGFIFATIENELAKVHVRNEMCGNAPKHESNNIEIGLKGTTAAWRALLDAIFSAISSDHPLAHSGMRYAAYFTMEKAVDLVYTEMNATLSTTSFTTLTELQTFQNTASCKFSKMVSNIYAVIGGEQHDLQTNTALDRHRNNTISDVELATQNIFNGIRILLATISSEAEARSKDHLSPIKALSKEALAYSQDFVQNVFDTIDLLLEKAVCLKKQV